MNNYIDPSTVEPAKVHPIEDNSSNDTPGENDTSVTRPEPQEHAIDERYLNLQAAYTKATQENASLRGENQKLSQRMTDIEYRLANQQQQTPVVNDEPDDLMTAAADFEELKPFAERMNELKAKLDTQEGLILQQKQQFEQSTQMSAQERHEQEILSVHPDVYTLMQDVQFNGWLARQPAYMQRVINEGNSKEIIDLFTAYKNTNSSKLDAAMEAGAPNEVGNTQLPINGNNGKVKSFKISEINAMTDAEFLANADAIDKAEANGAIIRDV